MGILKREWEIISRIWCKSGTEISNFFVLNVSRMEQTLIFQSSLHFPSPLRGKERGLIFHQFAETEKSYLRFSLSPAWNLRRRLISRRINLPSKPGAHPPHEPLHWHAPRFLQLVLFARIIRTHFRVKILPIPARTNIFHIVHSTNTSATV